MAATDSENDGESSGHWSVRSDILRFVRQPCDFAGDFADGKARDAVEPWRQGLSGLANVKLAGTGRELRPAQVAAWEGSATSRVALILGPPGTGKSQLLAWFAAGFVWARRQRNLPCRVLVTAFTREAIGNLLEKIAVLAAEHIPTQITFLGNPPGTLQANINAVDLSPQDLQPARDLLGQETVVVGATCWSLYKLFEPGGFVQSDGPSAPVFDLVLVDEASQIIVSQGLMALGGMARNCRVIVAGDDKQLPPLREAFDAPVGDGRVLGSSLYAFLNSAGVPRFDLNETFRLNEPLTVFSAEKFYEGNYVSAVKERELALRQGWEQGLRKWEQAALDPKYPIVVLLHDGPPAGTDSPFERRVIFDLVSALVPRLMPAKGKADLDAATLWSERLAVITPHRAQNAALRAALRPIKLCDDPAAKPVVETVERIQGRERDVIVAGYAVSDTEFALIEAPFLFSEQRLNVTVTRARSKVILLVSRRLLEVIPPDEQVFAAADKLREYVYQCQFVDRIDQAGPGGESYGVEVRVRQFDEALELPPLADDSPPVAPVLPPWTSELEKLLAAVKTVAQTSAYRNAPEFLVRNEMGRDVAIAEYLALVRHGTITVAVREGSYGPFWVFKPHESVQFPFDVDDATVDRQIADACALARGGVDLAPYARVRDAFVWFDDLGNDVFRLQAQRLEAAGVCRFATGGKTECFDLAGRFDTLAPDPAPIELAPPDWLVLNALEDEEVRRINFGAYETFVTPAMLVSLLGKPMAQIAASLQRLAAQQYVLSVDADEHGAVRSRMSEMARVVRYVKQRFNAGDANTRPYVVRALRVKVRDRHKPARNRRLDETIDELKQQLTSVLPAPAVLDAVYAILVQRWGIGTAGSVMAAEFQRRGMRQLLPAYLGVSNADAFVITADTGSGKTETACLPLIAGATIDRLLGRAGVKAILAYPRLRLAYNQAQRLTGYVAALAKQPGMPRLTIGLQSGDVPESVAETKAAYRAKLWVPLPTGGFRFPFFTCPVCDKDLDLIPANSPVTPDTLRCLACQWSYDGFVAFKQGLRLNPPDFFIPVTESLHQWLHDARCGRLFGDVPGFAPARAVVADEIHLYSHIHGAQVGYTLRRALARLHLNARLSNQDGDEARPPLAIGMSATLGNPAAVWGQLCGRDYVAEIAVRDTPESPGDPPERENNPAGREYFYFAQTEVESRGHEVAAASTTIQSLMALAHNMRRRPGGEGGYRGVVFFDSIDNLKGRHDDYYDAERSKGLAHYRETNFGPHPVTGKPRSRCCGNPADCDTFRAGECWYFAARAPTSEQPNDPLQVTANGLFRPGQSLAVMREPVYSKSEGWVDATIRRSDLVFATSSLEVGFDDREMILVYQHYAPKNLASFIQRKGRGGRGIDDRPVTGVTLSVYSPRDSWFFRHPDKMLDAGSFEVPLNMDNFFVRRGQALAAVLDGAARQCAQKRISLPSPIGVQQVKMLVAIVKEDLDAIEDLVITAIGKETWLAIGANNPLHLLEIAAEEASQRPASASPPQSWRDWFPWVPSRLFDSINLPLVVVSYPKEKDGTDGDIVSSAEDIGLAVGRFAPGNPTRNYGKRAFHWVPPGDVDDGPMFAEDGVANDDAYRQAGAEPLLTGNDADLPPAQQDRLIRRHLPQEVANRLPKGLLIHPKLCRSRTLRLETFGWLDRSNRGQPAWTPAWYWDAPNCRVVRSDPASADPNWQAVGEKSRSTLRGFSLVNANDARAFSERVDGLGRLARNVKIFVGGVHGKIETGLRVARAFWGLDVELTFARTDQKEQWSKAFTTRKKDQVLLHGYRVQTEGIQLSVRSASLDSFIDAQVQALASDEPRSRWLRGQFFRYLLSSGFAAAGLSAYAAGPLADLIVSTAGDEVLRQELAEQLKKPDINKLTALLRRAQPAVLGCHPLLQGQAFERHLKAIKGGGFTEVLTKAREATADAGQFRGYLRSLVLHGLGLSLRELFVLHGRGDERQVHMHAQLPVQFADRANDVLTVFEAGDGGDGTTRTFRRHAAEAFDTWRRGDLAECPHAAEDALIDLLFDREVQSPGTHARWRSLDPSDDSTLPTIARELTRTSAVDPLHLQVIQRVLFQTESVMVRRFEIYQLHAEIRTVRQQMALRLKRMPALWEGVSEVVLRARGKDPALQQVTQLLAAYEAIPAPLAGGINATDRLIEQVYRLSAALCVDGCPACLQRSSSLMPDMQAVFAVSRDLLRRYGEFILEPLTMKIDAAVTLPSAAQVKARVLQFGGCRMLIAPSFYDHVEAELAGLGFVAGTFDPLLNQVVSFRGGRAD